MTYFTMTRRGLRVRLGGMFGVAWFIPWRRTVRVRVRR